MNEKKCCPFNGLTRVNREQDIPFTDPPERWILRSPLHARLPADRRGVRTSTSVHMSPHVVSRHPPSHTFASHVPRESHPAGSILLHSRRGLSPKDGQLYKRDARCLKHVRRNRTGASSRPRRAAAPRSFTSWFPFRFILSPYYRCVYLRDGYLGIRSVEHKGLNSCM